MLRFFMFELAVTLVTAPPHQINTLIEILKRSEPTVKKIPTDQNVYTFIFWEPKAY